MNTVFKNVELNGKITDITAVDGKITSLAPANKEGIDCSGLKVCPGLIDVHIHGCGGHDVMDGCAIREMSALLATRGITSWFPTTMTAPHSKLVEITRQPTDSEGAKVCGFHLEGPYISPDYPGVQATNHMRSPNVEEFSEYNNVRIVTIAPELEGSNEFIDRCGAVVSLGHSGCTYEEAEEAFDRGALCVTHIFNTMPPFHHRKPSLIGAAMDKGAYAQFICDGVHLHKSAVQFLYKTFGRDRLVLISDSMRGAGLADGTYELGGRQITVKGNTATDSDGKIAGSVAFLGDCVKKAVEYGIDPSDAIKMATENPARMMGLNKGKICEGYDCDILLYDDNGNLVYTVSEGQIVYSNKN